VLQTAVFPPRLQRRTGAAGAGPAAAVVRPLGATAGLPGGQRGALGQALRPAPRPGVVAVGLGHRAALEPAPAAALQRGGGAVERCASAAELQQRLDEMDEIQRQGYQALQGRTRWEVYPQLGQARRPYRPAGEGQRWSLTLVLDYLAGLSVRRQVDGQGKVSL